MALRTIEVNNQVEFDDYRTKENSADDYLYLRKFDKTIMLSDGGNLITFTADYNQILESGETQVGTHNGNVMYQNVFIITREMLDDAIVAYKDSYNSQVVISLTNAPIDAVNAWIHDGYVTRTIDGETYNIPISGTDMHIGISANGTKALLDFVDSTYNDITSITLIARYTK